MKLSRKQTFVEVQHVSIVGEHSHKDIGAEYVM